MTSPAVPSIPVVLINIEDDTVSVNGVLVDHDGTQSLHQVGVHAAAERVAQVLQRPVRAIATDATSRTRLVVHPNGTATDLELLEDLTASLDVDDDQDLAPTEEETCALADVIALGDRREVDAPADDLVLVDATETDESPQLDEPEPPASVVARERRRRPALVVLVGGSVALVATLSAAAVAVSSGEAPAPERPAAVSTAPPSTPSYQVKPGATLTPRPRTLHITVTGDLSMLQMEISATRLPVRARIVVDPAGDGHVIERSVWLRDRVTTVVIRDLPPGRASWSVAVETAHTVTGTAKLTAPALQQPSSTYSPSPSANPSTSTGSHDGPTKGSGGTPPPTGPVGINDSPAPGPIGG
jgi:hypothetical protein